MNYEVDCDLKTFLREHLDSMVDDHYEVWKDQYYRKSKDQVEYMLSVGYDFSGDIDYVESELERELTDDEKEYFIECFTKALVDNFYQA